jgi:uncharacterized protein YgbK (DUF1537 family)
VGDIMMVGKKPLSLTETAHDVSSPVQESYASKLLRGQSSNSIGRIDLTHVASSCELLKKAIEAEQNKGNRIIIFDAVSRRDLTNIVDVAFSMDRKPLFVGSAGLAEEVAKKLYPSKNRPSQPLQRVSKPVQHIFIISGSASSVTHQQLKRLEERNIPFFELNQFLLTDDHPEVLRKKKELSLGISNSLSKGHAVLKAPSEILPSRDILIHLKITKTLAAIALMVLEESKVDVHDLVLILTGGETALSIINTLRVEEIEIEGELLEGIVKEHLIGGGIGTALRSSPKLEHSEKKMP